MEERKEDIAELLKDKPGAMARELARLLNVDKTALNKYLYHSNDNLGDFRRDTKYRWYVLGSVHKRIDFPDSWVTRDLFEEALSSDLSEIDAKLDSATFVFSAKCSFMLDSLALLLSLCNQLANEKVDVVLDFGKGTSFYYYLNRMGFFDQLVESITVVPKRPEISTAVTYNGKNESLIELKAIEPKNKIMEDEVVGKLTECFISLSDEKYRMAAFTIFSELIGNIRDHSETKLVSFAGLQMYRKVRHIQTVVSDSGLGIAKTLRSTLKENHPDLYKLYKKNSIENDIQLVSVAVGRGHISSAKEEGRGLGFARSKDWAKKFKATLSVRQERFSLEFDLTGDHKQPKFEVKENLCKISGTHFCFDFYI